MNFNNSVCVFFPPIPSELWGKMPLLGMFLPLLKDKELLEEKRHDDFMSPASNSHYTFIIRTSKMNALLMNTRSSLFMTKDKRKHLCMYNKRALCHLKLNRYITLVRTTSAV